MKKSKARADASEGGATGMAKVVCSACECERSARREVRAQEFSVRGEAVTLEIPVLVCTTCGGVEVDPAFGDPAAHALDAYRRKAKTSKSRAPAAADTSTESAGSPSSDDASEESPASEPAPGGRA